MKKCKLTFWLCSVALAVFAASPINPSLAQTASTKKLDDARLASADQRPQEWPTIGGTYDEMRYSQLDKINTDTVKDLKLAWYGDFDTTRGQEATSPCH